MYLFLYPDSLEKIVKDAVSQRMQRRRIFVKYAAMFESEKSP